MSEGVSPPPSLSSSLWRECVERVRVRVRVRVLLKVAAAVQARPLSLECEWGGECEWSAECRA